MIAFNNNNSPNEHKMKKAFDKLIKAINEVEPESLLDDIEPSTYLDTNLSEIVDIMYQSLFIENKTSINLFITKNPDNSLDLTIED